MKRCRYDHPMEGPEAHVRWRKRTGANGTEYTWSECLACHTVRSRKKAEPGDAPVYLDKATREWIGLCASTGIWTIAYIAEFYGVSKSVVERARRTLIASDPSLTQGG